MGQRSGQNGSYFWRRIDRALARSFADVKMGAQLIEIGAGASEWLPYLHSRFGFAVTGLDYSEVGCERARDNLARASTPGAIHQADMFKPPVELVERFDAVVSFGLIEHFSDTTSAVAACAAYAKSGGIVVTLIPNMKGLHGMLYRIYDKKVFDTHVPLSLKDLMRAHSEAGLEVVFGEYLLGLPGVMDQHRVEPVLSRRILRKLVFHISRLYWGLEEHSFGVRENAFTSPYLICAARKGGLI
jgi:SAM-dependent methyltransferase